MYACSGELVDPFSNTPAMADPAAPAPSSTNTRNTSGEGGESLSPAAAAAATAAGGGGGGGADAGDAPGEVTDKGEEGDGAPAMGVGSAEATDTPTDTSYGDIAGGVTGGAEVEAVSATDCDPDRMTTGRRQHQRGLSTPSHARTQGALVDMDVAPVRAAVLELRDIEPNAVQVARQKPRARRSRHKLLQRDFNDIIAVAAPE